LRGEYAKEGRLSVEAEEMYYIKVYIVPFSVHGGGTDLIIDVLSEEFRVDIGQEDETKIRRGY
jgi:hypothetical protein